MRASLSSQFIGILRERYNNKRVLRVVWREREVVVLKTAEYLAISIAFWQNIQKYGNLLGQNIQKYRNVLERNIQKYGNLFAISV